MVNRLYLVVEGIGVTIINSNKFPTIAMIQQVCPLATSKLPEDYNGKVEDLSLAYSLGVALENYSFAELIKIRPKVPDYMDTANAKSFAREFLRFGLPLIEIDSYYDFLNVLGRETLTLQEIRYCVSLASKYRGNRLTNALSVIRAIRIYQVNYLERHESELVYASVSELENLFSLAKVLRSEGIMMQSEHLWVASSHWSVNEVLAMIEEGLELRRAMELYIMGFTTMEEILEFSTILPDTWVDRVLNGPPVKKEATT